MQIVRNDEAATWTFFSTNPAEEEIVRGIATLEPKTKLSQLGSKSDEDGRPRINYFGYHGKHVPKVEKTGNITVHQTVYEGGVKFTLEGTSADDKRQGGSIRDVSFFGSSGLVFLGTTEVDGKLGVILTAMFCTKCSAPMISLSAVEWRICNACAAKCEHRYVRGIVHGGKAGNMGMGEYCEICGRGKPEPEGTRQKSQLERELEVQRETGVTVFDRDTGMDLQQITQAERLMRKHRRAKART
jgi:hypothetical protein